MPQAIPVFPAEGLKFLRSLKRNNNRDWFQAHKDVYEAQIKRPMEDLILALGVDFQKFAPEFIATPRKSLYRIYRDTRFSKDKSPYKTHVAASFPHKGLDRHQGAGLYLHISPTEILIGGGIYMPQPEDLNAVRGHIASNFAEFRRILAAKAFQKTFGSLWGEQLQRVPRGFLADDPAADYLRYKQYLASRTLKPEVAAGAEFYKVVVETFRAMLPFIRFVNEPILRNQAARKRQEALLSTR
jgi:uncharacterized protein (TIGR02453 family)